MAGREIRERIQNCVGKIHIEGNRNVTRASMK